MAKRHIVLKSEVNKEEIVLLYKDEVNNKLNASLNINFKPTDNKY